MAIESSVTSLNGSDVNAAGDLLARAFFDDPVVAWMLPDETKRTRALPWVMRLATRYGFRYGTVDITSGNLDGVGLWLPPESPRIDTLRIIRTGILLAPLKFGLAAFGRYMKWSNFSEHLHKRDMPPRHWYLPLIGVDPPQQGHGTGGKLMQPALARADSDRLPCYLENTKERNLPFYGSHGFEVVHEIDVPDGGPTIWTMKREPIG